VFDVKIGNKVRVNNLDSPFYEREGVIEDFENLQLRDENSLILVSLNDRRGLDWFYGWELEVIK
jgi:hypothetical protein